MDVVPLTLTISLCLVFTFVVFFLREQSRGRVSSAERDSLLPLAEETPALAHARAPLDSAAHGVVGRDDRRRLVPAASSATDVRSFGEGIRE